MKRKTMGLLYEELSYAVRGCIYDVQNEVGTGYDEESYQMALEKRLLEKNIPFRSQEARYVKQRGKRVHKFVLDLIIDDKIILELKVLESNFHPENIFQLLSYLKCWKKQLGFLVNFGLPSVAIKRVPFTEKEKRVIEDYDYIKDRITPEIRQSLYDFRAAVLALLNTHGLGFGEKVYRDLLLDELKFRKIEFLPQTAVPVEFNGHYLKDYKIKWPIINNQFIGGIAVLKDDIKLDIIKMKNYLEAINLPLGLLVHFGKEVLEIHGIASKSKKSVVL